MEKVSSQVYIVIGITLFSFLFIFFIISFLIIYQNRQKKNVKEKQDIKNQYETSLLQTQLEIQEQTLKTISEEIHDNIGQVLSLAKLYLNTFPPDTDSATQNKVAETKTLVSKAINDLRDLSRSLHGEKISEVGLYEAVENELRILHNTKQFETSLDTKGNRYKLDPQKEMVIFRMVQETLHNAVKHSKAKKISVQLDYSTARFVLTVTDNGVGFNTAALSSTATGIGLKNMYNRAALIGGKFSIHSIPGNGTSTTIELENSSNLKP